MPVYNAEKFIRRALDSLLGQTFDDFELIISDNASTDGTELICIKYASIDQRIRFLRQVKNIGAATNFQFVLDEAVGEYFVFAAHDDWWGPNFIQELSLILDTKPDVVLSFCTFNHVDLNYNVFRNYPIVHKIGISEINNRRIIGRNSFEKYLLQNLKHGKVNLIYGLMRRKELVSADIIRRWGDFSWGADLLMVATILRFGNVDFAPKTLWHKTENPESSGSLLPRISPPSLFESACGSMGTLLKYTKYSIGIWKVQGTIPGTKKINTIRRIGFTLFEYFRMMALFIYQVFYAFLIRLKFIFTEIKRS